jgi:beta-glucosidase
MTHNSQEEGSALADVIFGDYNPAGRLVQTWPRSIDQLPPLEDYDIRKGRTYMYFKGQPLYPFGYGLSYTRFSYSNLRTGASSLSGNGSTTVSVDIRNVGRRAGEEVVQLYASFLDSEVVRPDRMLVGFSRVSLVPGQTKRVDLELRASQLAYWDAGTRRFVVEGGRVRLVVGSSSADSRLVKTLAIKP